MRKGAGEAGSRGGCLKKNGGGGGWNPLINYEPITLQAVLIHVFWLQKNTYFCEIPKIYQVMFLTFSSYSIKILANYLNFLNLAHFLISRNLFLVI